jgi:hypothetical protein
MKEVVNEAGFVSEEACGCGLGYTCSYHTLGELDDAAAEIAEAVAAHPASWKPRVFNTVDLGPRVLTFTLEGGREVMLTIFTDSGEVTLAERERADHTLPWSAPLRPTSDSAVTWR